MMGGYFHVRFKYLFIEYNFKRLYVVVKWNKKWVLKEKK
jgi:hypothetical protein